MSSPVLAARSLDLDRLWAGRTMSILGAEVNAFALPTIALVFLHASPLQFGLLGLCTCLPQPVLGLLAGAWVDRLPRRTVLLAADATRGAAIVSIPLAALAGVLTIGQLLLVGLVVGTASVFFGAAYRAYLPDVLPPDEVDRAAARLSASETGAQVAGPTLAGVLIRLLGPAGPMLASASSFASSILGLLLVRRAGSPPARPRASLVPQARDGLPVILGNPLLLRLTLGTVLSQLGQGICLGLVLLFGYSSLRLAPAAAGVVLAVGGAGGYAGSRYGGRVVARFGAGPTLLAGGLLGGLPWLLAPAVPAGGAAVALAALIAVSSFLVPVTDSAARRVRQALVTREVRARVAVTTGTLMRSALPVAALLGGILAQAGTAAFGARTGVALVLALGGLVWAAGSLPLPRERLLGMRPLAGPDADTGTVHSGRWRGRHRAPAPALNPRALLDTVAAAVTRR